MRGNAPAQNGRDVGSVTDDCRPLTSVHELLEKGYLGNDGVSAALFRSESRVC